MRDPATLSDSFGVVCPSCFAIMADERGVSVDAWHFGPHADVSALWIDADGRVWDAEQCLWVAAGPAVDVPAALDVQRLREAVERVVAGGQINLPAGQTRVFVDLVVNAYRDSSGWTHGAVGG